MKFSCLILLIVILSCADAKKSSVGLPRVYGQIPKTYVKANSNGMIYAQARVLAVDFKSDTIANQKRFAGFKTVAKRNVQPKYDLRLLIDTTYNLYARDFEFQQVPLPYISSEDRKKYCDEGKVPSIRNYFKHLERLRSKYIVTQPVLIYNAGKDSAYVYSGTGNFPMIQEALDTDGNWKPIEFYAGGPGGCIPMPDYYYAIEPEHYLAAAIIKYHGSFKTKIRVKMRSGNEVYYSNSVTGYVNPTQFDDAFAFFYIRARQTFPSDSLDSEDKRYFSDFMFLNKFTTYDGQNLSK